MKIIICGNYGAGNLGDEMILEGMLESLESVIPNAEITIFSGNPKQTFEKTKLNSVEKFPTGIKSFLKSIFRKNNAKQVVKECDYFILGGGGLFGSLTFRANLIWGIQAWQVYRHKKPVIMYGQSIGQLKGLRKIIVKKLFNKADFIALRDTESKKRLESLGIMQKIHMIPDLAFNITKVPKNSGLKEHKELIVALRGNGGLNKNSKNIIREFLQDLISKNWKIRVINFQKNIDEKLHKEITKDLQNTETLDIKNTKQLLEAYSTADLVLGMRLHSIISAIKTETPFIAISYADKVKNLLSDAKLTEYMLTTDEISLEKLENVFSRTLKEYENIKLKLQKYNQDCATTFLESCFKPRV